MTDRILGRFFHSTKDTPAQRRVSEPALGDMPADNVPPIPAGQDGAATGMNASVPPETSRMQLIEQRVALHRYLLDRINLGIIDTMSNEQIIEEIKPIVREYIKEQNFPVSARELDQLIIDTTDEMLGLGPLEPLLKDDTISDILVNSHKQIFIERGGQLELTNIQFKDEDHLLRIISKIVSAVGRRVDESSPICDARLADGSRVNVAVRPIAIDGPMISIRKFSKRPYTMERLVVGHSLAKPMQLLLSAAVRGRKSMIVSGGTGSGKTTLLNALSSQISNKERLITIEDAAELQLQQIHVCRLETKPPTLDGRNEIRQRELVRNALRMRPDRIIVGEVRGEEAFDMLQAMNTGHEGSMSTIHANSPRDAISRLEQMIGMAGMPMSQISIRQQIASALDVIVQVERLHDGTRKVVSVTEITGMENDVIQMQEIFGFRKTGIDENNRVQGFHFATGLRPRFLDEISEIGIKVPDEVFDPSRMLPYQ